jgi:hypothetical protein
MTSGAKASASGAASPLALSGLAPGQAYQCTAIAANAQGNSKPSNVVTLTPTSRTAQTGNIDNIGDGFAKILARNNTIGQSFLGSLNAQNQIGFHSIADPGPNYRLLGAGDLRGVGRSDLLMQEMTSGLVKVWLGFDGPLDNEYWLRTVKPGWVVEAVLDIDGDGKADLVWRYVGSPLNPPADPGDLGTVFVWFMNGTTIDQIKARGGAPLSWALVGAADLHGSRRGDLVFVSPSRDIRILTSLAGRNFVNEFVGKVPDGYTLTRLGDFDGDGKADLLFQDASNNLVLWRMNGSTIAGTTTYRSPDPNWTLYSVGDLNGDAKMDIVWKKTDGTFVVWLMGLGNGGEPLVLNPAGTAPNSTVPIDP